MRKQLGILASLLFLGVSALLWTGCSGYNRCSDDCYEPCEPMCEPCKPICPPLCKPDCPDTCKPICPPQCPSESYESYPQPSGMESFNSMDLDDSYFQSSGSDSCNPCPPPCAEPCRPCPPCRPACPPPCAEQCKPCPPPCQVEPVCPPPSCPPRCAAPLKPCKYGPAGECSCNGVTVIARNPKMCMLGDQYPLELDISACCDVCDVMITTTLPEGVSFMRSQPEARLEGRELIWEFGHIDRGQTIRAKIWLKCEREGDLCTCFCVQATPVAFCGLLCAKPVLVCEKLGPCEVCPGDPINYVINVTNIGTCTAEDVVVTDTLPDGVEHASCQQTLNFRLGCIEPCCTKTVKFCVTACKRGKICNTAVVSACNANQTSCEFCTCVCCCAIECQKVGPKEMSVGQNADYQITVVNTGDKSLHEVVVTDVAPSATAIVAAPGASVSCKEAVWKLRELKPGERVTFNLTLTTCTPGYFSNNVHVTNCEGCNACCEFGTHWKGRPALDVCISSLDNPICIGETSRFKIIVTNKGQEYDSNVSVVVNLPPELVPVNASGAAGAQVNGQTVTFAPFPNLAPRQTLEYYVTVKAEGHGDLRPKVQVSSDFIKNPITQEESLIVN